MDDTTVLNRAAKNPVPAGGVGFRRTVDRSLVHRESLAEVFLTDGVRLPDNGFLVASQLPRQHAYFGDQSHRPALHDPLLLAEAARQAVVYISHQFLDVPLGTKFILNRLNLSVDRPSALLVGQRPGEMEILVRADNLRRRDGQVSGVDFALELTGRDAGRIGEAELMVRYRDPAAYQVLRDKNRGGRELHTTATMRPPVPVDRPARPGQVGRRNPGNVVITEPRRDGDVLTAELLLPVDNPSMFDHPQDHIPGMVLIESARQLAFSAATERFGYAPNKLVCRSLRMDFSNFGELEPATLLSATAAEGDGEITAQVDVVQEGSSIAGAEVLLVPVLTQDWEARA